MSVLKQNGTVISTHYYSGNYELVDDQNPLKLYYIYANNSLIAIITMDNSGTVNENYTYTDQLGSILTVTDGIHTVNQSFDAWGRNRNPTDWTYSNIPTVPGWLYRGYTGHEHLPQFALINMNGRMYDPLLGRMLSPDNMIHDPTGSQSYNRYSYASNNPLKYTDPTGWDFIGGDYNNATNGMENSYSSWSASIFGASELSFSTAAFTSGDFNSIGPNTLSLQSISDINSRTYGEVSPDVYQYSGTLTTYKNGVGSVIQVLKNTNGDIISSVFISSDGSKLSLDPKLAALLLGIVPDGPAVSLYDNNLPSQASNQSYPLLAGGNKSTSGVNLNGLTITGLGVSSLDLTFNTGPQMAKGLNIGLDYTALFAPSATLGRGFLFVGFSLEVTEILVFGLHGHNILDFGIMGLSLVPVVGPFIGGGYMIANFGTQYYFGQSPSQLFINGLNNQLAPKSLFQNYNLENWQTEPIWGGAGGY